jgi:uncharacterized membrane protein
MGYGHVYAPQHYVDAWVAVTGVSDWTPDALEGLKAYLLERAQAAMEDEDGDEGAYEGRGG